MRHTSGRAVLSACAGAPIAVLHHTRPPRSSWRARCCPAGRYRWSAAAAACGRAPAAPERRWPALRCWAGIVCLGSRLH